MRKVVQLNLIEPNNQTNWASWLDNERKCLRIRFPLFGPEDEIFWPNDYYEQLESWWTSSEKARLVDPIRCHITNGIYHIDDGWHRFAISKKHNINKVPVLCEG